jgi:thymidine phosphorylase
MVELGREAGRQVVCLLTDMDQPLGNAVGNVLELREAMATLRGEGPSDFTELVVSASAQLLALSDLGVDAGEGRRRAEQAIADGSAIAAYERWIAAQGGDPDEGVLRSAPVVYEVESEHEGFVGNLSAMGIGLAALELGAGRRTKEDSIDHSVGVVCLRKRGDRVRPGEALAEIHASDHAFAERVADDVLAAYEIGDEPPKARPVVLEILE